MSSNAATLYSVEDHLNSLLESAELVTPEQEQEYRREVSEALRTAIAKRDKVANYLTFLGSQITLAKEEEARLVARRKRFEVAITKLSQYVLDVIREFGMDAKGKYPKLEGHTSTLAAKKCPASVEIIDQAQVPAEYLRVHLEMSMNDWLDVAIAIGAGELASRLYATVKSEPSKTSIRAAFERGVEVRGCRLVTDKLRLEVE